MKLVHFLAGKNDPIIEYLLFPIRLNRNRLLELGYRVKILREVSEKCFECDVLCLVSKPTMQLLRNRTPLLCDDGPVIRLIDRARKRNIRVLWFDSSDSTGVTHFELLPYVDGYYKKQLLKNRDLYRQPLYGGRLFSDFYHRSFGVTDPNPFNQYYPLHADHQHKLRLSWNIGVGDVSHSFKWRGILRTRFPAILPMSYKYNLHRPGETNRPLDLLLRTSTNLSRPSIAYHRQELVQRLKQYSTRTQSQSIINGPKQNRRRFEEAMASSKIMPSPFGWGELGVRDYEAIFYGAALLKPDLSHMETWPNIFIDGVTCVMFRWDFQDLNEKIEALIENNTRRYRIVLDSQQAYSESVSEKNMERFCHRFAAMMNPSD